MGLVAAADRAATETIGERLRRIRLEQGLSQRSLTGPGVSYAYISRIESGTRQPSVRALRVLAGKLGVSAEYLETGSDWTPTDYLLDEVTRSLLPEDDKPAGRPPLLIDARDPHRVIVKWRRVYAAPSELEEAAGLHGGLSAPRSEEGTSLTDALMRVLAREDALDRLDAERVAVIAAAREIEQQDPGRPLTDEGRNDDDLGFEV